MIATRTLGVVFAVMLPVLLSAQTRSVSGTVLDMETQISLPGANVALLQPADSSLVRGTVTNVDGEFAMEGLNAGTYLLRTSFLGYHPEYREIDLRTGDRSNVSVVLERTAIALQAVEVEEQMHQSVQRNDTTEFNAGAFKVNPDADTEDLILKMPGVSIEGGQVQAQGEEVKQVMVDGKPFFGEDARATLRNLPAEVVDKIQISDYKSDQSRFTGFNDGEEGKTINIVTKPEFRNGTFGRVYGGYGDEGRYKAGGNINFFNDARRITLLFQTNNINQQNFSPNDLSGVAGATGGGRGGRGGRGRFGGGTGNFAINARDGIATTTAGGLNFSDEWGKRLKINASYFYNRTDRVVENSIFREFVLPDSDGLTYDERESLNEITDQHRVNMRLEYEIDSMNSVIFTPSVNYSSSRGNSSLLGANRDVSGLLNTVDRGFDTELQSLNISAPILFQHKFRTPRRTLSVQLTPGYNRDRGQNFLFSENRFFEDSLFVDSLDQEGQLYVEGYNVSSNVAYTEPVGEKGMLQISWNSSYTISDSRNEVFSRNPLTGGYDLRDSLLNNVFESSYHTQRLGTEYNHNWEKLQITLGLSYQWAELSAVQQFPVSLEGLQNFNAVLPNARITYKFDRNRNFRLFYRASNNPPSIQQLQNVVNNSNPVRLTIGNPNLKQDYRHGMFMRYSASNPEKSTTSFIGGGFSYTNNFIGDATTVARADTVLAGGVLLPRGAQLVQPVNLDGQLGVRLFGSFGLPVKPLKSNLNINGSARYSRTPGLINGDLNWSNTPSLGLGLSLGSNISESVDFTLSSNTAYNWVFNTLQPELNSSFWSQRTRGEVIVILFKSVVFTLSADHQYFDGLSEGFNQNFVLLNSGLGYKFLKNRRAELRLQAFDLLGANVSVQREFSDVFIEDRQVNVLQRFFMLTFTYNIRNFSGPLPGSEQQRRWR